MNLKDCIQDYLDNRDVEPLKFIESLESNEEESTEILLDVWNSLTGPEFIWKEPQYVYENIKQRIGFIPKNKNGEC